MFNISDFIDFVWILKLLLATRSFTCLRLNNIYCETPTCHGKRFSVTRLAHYCTPVGTTAGKEGNVLIKLSVCRHTKTVLKADHRLS